VRILFADSISIWGGAQRFILESAIGLAARGHDVTIQTLPGSPLAQKAREQGLTVREVRTRADAAPWTVVPLAFHMRAHPYDVVYTTFDKDLRTTGLAGRIAGRGTVVIHSRECDDPVKNKSRYRWFYTKVADHVVVNSESTLKTTLESARWLDRNRTSIVYKGIDLDDYLSIDASPWRDRLAGLASAIVRRDQ